MSSVCTVRTLSPSQVGPDERDAWQDLALHAGDAANVFLEPWFLQAALTQFDPDGETRLLVAEDSDGRWHGLMVVARAAYLGRRPMLGLASCVWSHPNQFLGTPLLRKGSEEACWRVLLEALDVAGSRRIALTMRNIPADDPAIGALHCFCASTGRPFRIVSRTKRPFLDLVDDTRRTLNPKRSARLRRQAGRLQADHGYAFETLGSASDVAAWTDEFLMLESGGWKGVAGSALGCDPRTTALFRAAMRDGFDAGRLHAHRIRAGGRVIAMMTYFVRGGRAYGFKACYDEAFAAYAPGLLLLQEVMRRLDAPILFDSCADAIKGGLGDMWTGRREIFNICVALGRGRHSGYKATMAVLDVWRALKTVAPKAVSQSPA